VGIFAVTIKKAGKKFKEFHLKDPNAIVKIHAKIPRRVFPIGYCPQISYNSDKWEKNGKFHSYIHWWENPTLVCVSENLLPEYNILDKEYSSFDLGPGRLEITFLGHAIDFGLTEDDRSHIDVGPATIFTRNRNPESDGEIQRLQGSYVFEFDDNPSSKDYVACSPNGRVVYVISKGEVFCFYNPKCNVTSHGIEG